MQRLSQLKTWIMNYTNTSQLGTEHREWLNKLEFYKNDISTLNKRLTEIAANNASPVAKAEIEHFQNQFIVQQNNIDELRHKVNENMHHAFLDVKDHAGHVSTASVRDYKKTDEEVQSFEKVMNELRREFKQFLTKWI
jgi:molecular chaperone GrpE (heat shock protein)